MRQSGNPDLLVAPQVGAQGKEGRRWEGGRAGGGESVVESDCGRFKELIVLNHLPSSKLVLN